MKTRATLAVLVIFSLMLSLFGSPVLAGERHDSNGGSDSNSRHVSLQDGGDRGDNGRDFQNNDREANDDGHDNQTGDGQPTATIPPTIPPDVTPPPVVPPPTTPPPTVPPPTTPPPTVPPPAPVLTPPTASTLAASSITTSGVTLNGNLTGLGTAASVNVSFQYGLTSAYGSVTAAQAKTATGPVSADITGLAQNTVYHFRVMAAGDGTVNGADLTFTTAITPIAPAVITGGATGVDTNTATLQGTLTSLGTATSVSVAFDWGTSTAYGNTTSAQVLAATGSFSAILTGLTGGTTYYFRATATGTSAVLGGSQSVTTAALPPPPPPPPPALPTTPSLTNGLIPIHFTLPEYQGLCTSCH